MPEIIKIRLTKFFMTNLKQNLLMFKQAFDRGKYQLSMDDQSKIDEVYNIVVKKYENLFGR